MFEDSRVQLKCANMYEYVNLSVSYVRIWKCT